MSNENDEQNSVEVDCPRCEGCGQLADSDDREPWSVWMALPVGSALAVTVGLVKPEPCDECGGTGKATTQPAGEHHTGTLNLTGEGNAPASPNSDDIVQIAERAYEAFGAGMQDALEAAYPAIRQQVAEEIAVALEGCARGLHKTADSTRRQLAEAHHAGDEYNSDRLRRVALGHDHRADGLTGAAVVAREIGAKA